MKTERQKMIKKLDKLFSEYIRKRAIKRAGGCERCQTWKGSWKELDCAHYHSRRKYSTRWHELNACGLCGGCHFYLDSHPQEKIDFFRVLLNGDFEKLNISAEMMARYSDNDYTLTAIYLKQKIKELKEG